jgi:uncharacterized protein YjiS (DUF1127 family)
MLRRNTKYFATQKGAMHWSWTMLLMNFLTAAATAVADWRRRQRAYEELMALDDHCLADLGIERAQINAYLAEGRRKQDRLPAAKAGRRMPIGKRKAA